MGDESVDCKDGEKVTLQKNPLLRMVCKNGAWVVREGRAAPGSLPCEDKAELSANGTCLAEEGHCLQYTEKGAEMDRDCAGTCGQFSSYRYRLILIKLFQPKCPVMVAAVKTTTNGTNIAPTGPSTVTVQGESEVVF